MTVILVRKLLRDLRGPLAGVMLLLFLFSMLWVKIAHRVSTEIAPFFNSVAAMSKLNPKVFEEVLFRGPGRISQAVMGGAEIRFERPTDFLAVELLHPVVITVICLWSVSRSAGAVSGELDRGTLELLLSQPIPRSRVILAHAIVDAIVIPLIALSIAAGTRAGLAAVGPFTVDYSVLDDLKKQVPIAIPRGPAELEVDPGGQWGALVNLIALMFAISGLGIAISSVQRSRWRAMGLTAGIVLCMFTLNVTGQLWDSVAWARPGSLFFYYQPQRIWLQDDWWTESPGLPGAVVLAAVGLIGYVFAWRWLENRDLPAPL